MNDKARINWRSEEVLKALALAMANNEPINKLKLTKEVAPLLDRDYVSINQLKNGLDLLTMILGENNIMVGDKYIIRNSAEAERKIVSYFNDKRDMKETSLRIVSDRARDNKKLRDFLKLKKVYDILSSFGKKGALSSELAPRYESVTGNKFSPSAIKGIINLINKYQIKGFRRDIIGREYRYFFYDEEAKSYIDSRIQKLSRDLGVNVEVNTSLSFSEREDLESKLETGKVKVTDSVSLEGKLEAIKVLYLNSQKGISASDLSRQLFLRLGGRPYGLQVIENMLKEFKEKLDPEIYVISGIDNYKVLNYSRAITVFAPSKARVSFSIKVPIEVSIKSTLSGVQFDDLSEVDRDDNYVIYDVTAKNSLSLMKGLVKLSLGFGVIQVDEPCISKVKSIILTKSVKEKVNRYIESIINNNDSIID